MRNRYAAIVAICCCAGLAACSQDSNPTPVSAPHIKSAAARKGPSVEELTAGMAVAPAMGKGPQLGDLKFELAERPKVGQILEVNLALVPKFDGGPATVQFGGSPGLDAMQGDEAFELPEVVAGEVYRHTLHLMPSADGVLLVNLTVSLKHDEVSDSQVFTVPVIVDR